MQFLKKPKETVVGLLAIVVSGLAVAAGVYGFCASKAVASPQDPIDIKVSYEPIRINKVSTDYVLPEDKGNTLHLHEFTSVDDAICDDCGLIRSLDIVEMDNPVTGKELPTTVSFTASEGATAKITWSPADSIAKASTTYKATIVFQAKSGFKFSDDIKATFDGSDLAFTNNNGKITVTKTFDKTGAAVVTPPPVAEGDWVIDKDGILSAYKGTGKNVVIPSTVDGITVKEIAFKTFYNNRTIESVTIPDSVTKIGNYAFAYCTNLKTVSIGNGVKTIGAYAFSSSGIQKVEIPSSVEAISFAAFWKCGSLKEAEIPETVNSIESKAFVSCSIKSICIDPDKFSGAFDSTVVRHDFTDDSDILCDKCGYIRRIDISGIDQPSKGTDLDTSFVCSCDQYVDVTYAWDPDDSTAKESTVYTITFTISPKSGYSCDGNTKISIEGIDYEFVYSDAKITVVKKFPQTAAAPSTDTPASTVPSTSTPSISPIVSPSTVTPSESVDPKSMPEVSVSFEDFIERLYVVALARPSEAEGKAFWVDMVKNHDFTGADCAREFLLSKEFKSKTMTDEEFVEVLYLTFFDRDPAEDKDGFNFWLNSIKQAGRDNAVEGFINSTEWCNLCATYGIKSGATTAKATIASKNAEGFATRLYTCCLGRDPETDGLKFWSLSLTNLEITGYDAANQFFTSAEFKGFKTSDEEFISRLYLTFMDREKDDAGLKFWLNEMNNGMSREQVIKEFAKSQEFSGICSDYGIARGEF